MQTRAGSEASLAGNYAEAQSQSPSLGAASAGPAGWLGWAQSRALPAPTAPPAAGAPALVTVASDQALSLKARWLQTRTPTFTSPLLSPLPDPHPIPPRAQKPLRCTVSRERPWSWPRACVHAPRPLRPSGAPVTRRGGHPAPPARHRRKYRTRQTPQRLDARPGGRCGKAHAGQGRVKFLTQE